MQYVLLAGTGCITILFYLLSAIVTYVTSFKAPVVGYRHFLEPAWLVGLRFGMQATPMIRDGYNKFKDSYFKVQRNDDQLLIIPRRHVNDLRDVPESKLNGMEAHMRNMLAEYTIGNMHMMATSDLHRRAIQRKLTPLLGTLIPALKDELDYATKLEVADSKDWIPISIDALTVGLVSRISARIFVGPELCRNPEWLYVSVHFTENLGYTRNILRLFPKITRPIAARCMPWYWRIYQNLWAAQRLLGPVITKRKSSIKNDPDYAKPNDFLQWMLDDARPDEEHPNDIAHRQLLVSLAAIHTTSMSVSHFIYDLCAYPQYIEPLRDEIIQTLREDGGFKKTTLHKLRKMDSFLKESQRMNPPLVLSFQRIVKTPLTLKDGAKIPTGTHLAMASDAISHDPAYLPGGGDPEVFDPFRYSRLREEEANKNKFQFATTDDTNLHFGHGLYACPGRFFASNEAKLILSHVLIMCDFKFHEGQTRPKNLSYEEACYPDPAVRVLMRRRAIPEKDIAAIILGN
ncbi:hypothetical protein QQS21_007454 [Conoideocrella luteorostrata]|uniref:P450 monooxygenase n=1 Tax=Conoideocrella luteorostrata TaxID=1105319 RepID=A0AAJ0CKP0_9HYPO|nr:hypothetical protein QQS21_007454 [Conoideocrella luteorostrata]